MPAASSRIAAMHALVVELLLLFNMLTMTASLSLPAAVPSPRPLQSKKRWLVVDFDGTCTQDDTTGLLPKLAAKLTGESVEERVEDFNAHVKDYFRLYNAAKERMCHESMSLEQALESLDDVSNVVTAQVSASRILKGLNVSPEDMMELVKADKEVAEHVKLHKGCLDVLARQTANDWQLGILSINWCPSLIHATVVSPLRRHAESQTFMNVPIWSNAVDETGVVSLKVPGALAKRACIAKLQPSNHVVYVGDSSTDLLALLEADLGILIGSCESAAATAKRWGVQVLPLSERRGALVNTSTHNVIWVAESWSEIDHVLKDFTI